jgi:hypothetical protein
VPTFRGVRPSPPCLRRLSSPPMPRTIDSSRPWLVRARTAPGRNMRPVRQQVLPLYARQFHGATGSTSAHSPRRSAFACASMSAYCSRRSGGSSLAWRLKNQARPGRTYSGPSPAPPTRTRQTSRRYWSILLHLAVASRLASKLGQLLLRSPPNGCPSSGASIPSSLTPATGPTRAR